MASDINVSLIGGRLGSNPERKGEGGPVTFRLASNRWVPGRDGVEGREDTSWLTIISWGQLAERVETTYIKGDRVLVEGRIQVRQWEDPDSGKPVRAPSSSPPLSTRWVIGGALTTNRPHAHAAVQAVQVDVLRRSAWSPGGRSSANGGRGDP